MPIQIRNKKHETYSHRLNFLIAPSLPPLLINITIVTLERGTMSRGQQAPAGLDLRLRHHVFKTTTQQDRKAQKGKRVDVYLILEGSFYWFYPVPLLRNRLFVFHVIYGTSKPLNLLISQRSKVKFCKQLNTPEIYFSFIPWAETERHLMCPWKADFCLWKLKKGQLSVAKTAQSSLQHKSLMKELISTKQEWTEHHNSDSTSS